jgi:hypothetical protein
MFSTGQLIFACLFLITFVIAMVYAYRKDVKVHREFYKGSFKILIAFSIFIGILFFIKFFFKH